MTNETKFTVGEYTTRNEGKAMVFIVNDNGALIGARQLSDGTWAPEMWFGDGRAKVAAKSPHDLMPPLREWWIGVTGNGAQFALRSQPDKENEWSEIIHVREVRDDQA